MISFDDAEALIRDADAAVLLGCSKATFWRRVADGTIPRPIKIGGISRWPRAEILAVIEHAKSQRSRTSVPNSSLDQRRGDVS